MTPLQKAQAGATLLSPLLIAVLGVWIQQSIANQDSERGYVELAISILKGDGNQQNPALRKWAVQILNEASPVPLDNVLQVQLETGETKLAAPTAPTVITVR